MNFIKTLNDTITIDDIEHNNNVVNLDYVKNFSKQVQEIGGTCVYTILFYHSDNNTNCWGFFDYSDRDAVYDSLCDWFVKKL